MHPKELRINDLASQSAIDPSVKALMLDEGIDPNQSVEATADQLQQLDAVKFNQVVERYQELEMMSPDIARRSETLHALQDRMRELWQDHTAPMIDDANEILKVDVLRARSHLHSNDIPGFEELQKNVEETVQQITAGMRQERTNMSEVVRSTLGRQSDLFSTDDVKRIVEEYEDHLMQTPQAIKEVAAAPQIIAEERQLYEQARAAEPSVKPAPMMGISR